MAAHGNVPAAEPHGSGSTRGRRQVFRRRDFLTAGGLATLGVVGAPWPGSAAAEPESPDRIFEEAIRLFFAGRPAESARAFDRLVAVAPGSEPDLWQRGLALYYAERFAEGRRQFELHRTVNPADVENVAWHFACVARVDGPEAARRAIIPVGEDGRVPMREIHALFAGRAQPAAVLAAADAGPEPARRNQLLYAHQYLGLYAESIGDAARAREHMLLAAGPFSMSHYMGKVAQVHVALRGWKPAAAP